MWDLIVSVPDHCLSFYFCNETSFGSGKRSDWASTWSDYVSLCVLRVAKDPNFFSGGHLTL